MQSHLGDDLYLLFLGSLIEELGAKMYPSVTASVAELVSNAWDADAKNVWITMPLGKKIGADGNEEIVVVDDGIGMSREEARLKYLIVGRKRRSEEKSWTTPSGRPLHGRKGVGKLAAFGTAKLLQCNTLTEEGERTAFKLNYDDIRSLGPGERYKVNELPNYTSLTDPDNGVLLNHGTEIKLSNLLAKVIPAESQFKASLARRFGVLSPEMNVFLNGTKVKRFDIPVDIRFPRDGVPEPGRGLAKEDPYTGEPSKPIAIADGWAVEMLPEGKVRWWIGFTPMPIDAADLRGISVLAHQKMVQKPFMFGRSQGTAGQLGQEYLVGEVIADWIDDNIQPDDDLVETNRNELQLEDERLLRFLDWGRTRLRWALARRNDLREKKITESILLDSNLQHRLEGFTPREQGIFKGIGGRLSRLPEVVEEDVHALLSSIMDTYDDKSIREMIEHIREETDPIQERMWALIAEFGLIDARRTATKVQARMQVISKLEELVESGAPEVPDIHNHLRDNPWLLDPRWELYGDEVNLTKMLREKHGYAPEGQGNKVDYLFAIGPTNPTSADEVIVVEIKRGKQSDGSTKHVSLDEVYKFSNYIGDAEAYYEKADSPSQSPTVRGLMVASGYTQEAVRQRKQFELIPGGIYQFKSWRSVLRDTRRLHLWWLELSSSRSIRAS